MSELEKDKLEAYEKMERLYKRIIGFAVTTLMGISLFAVWSWRAFPEFIETGVYELAFAKWSFFLAGFVMIFSFYKTLSELSSDIVGAVKGIFTKQ